MVGTLPDYPSDVKYLVSVWHGIYKTSIIRDNHIVYESERLYPSEDLLFHIDFCRNARELAILKMQCITGASIQIHYLELIRVKSFLNM